MCFMCDKQFATNEYLKRHYKSHMETEYLCLICKGKFSNQNNLKRHENTKHNTITFGCKVSKKGQTKKTL